MRVGCLKGIVERKIFNLHERTIDKSPGFAKGTEICKRWEVNMEVGQSLKRRVYWGKQHV